MADAARRARVRRLLNAARSVANPAHPSGEQLRRRLLETTGLSAPNIELGLSRCLETQVSDAELTAFLAAAPPAERAHVLLSGNVFVAALRAIALGLAAADAVQVRPSRRDPALAQALHALEPELFDLVDELAPAPGERYFAYGSDETLSELRQTLPRGVWLHPHGSGFGVIVLDGALTPAEARDAALDTVLFDQRGCLSPRVVCVRGDESAARQAAQALATQLTALEREVPRGARSPEEAAAERRERDAAAFAFELFEAGPSWVSLSEQLVLPPASRCLHVTFGADAAAVLAPHTAHLTGIATNGERSRHELATRFPTTRVVALGELQRPAFDGPVDRRARRDGQLLR